MVVWQGITQDGTAVPVQITEEGKVVAIGEAGPEGPPGPEGPEGPPGETFPPDPFEGAFLVYLNGRPTWYAEQPTPIPAELIGPIIDIPSNDTYTVAATIPTDIFYQNRPLVKANSEGIPIYKDWNQKDWTNNTVLGNSWSYSQGGPFNGKAGEVSDGICGSNSTPGKGTVVINLGQNYTGTARINGNGSSGLTCTMTLSSGRSTSFTGTSGQATGKWSAETTSSTFNTITVSVSPDNDGSMWWSGIEVNGQLLVDLDVPLAPAATGVVSAVFGSSILLSRITGEIGLGDYLLAEEAVMAQWLIQKRGIKLS